MFAKQKVQKRILIVSVALRQLGVSGAHKSDWVMNSAAHPVLFREGKMMDVGMDIADVLVHVGFAKTKSEGRRFIKEGAIRLGKHKITDPFARVVMQGNQIGVLEKQGWASQ